ncbi:MAG: hypothetical protein U1A23_00585 [Candidatus Sungbacteria bacterium]|nr:hypothetical protein [bacterium]MDZ4285404.1 hypothetical protein [Candidatus Sungbacteria bacterium]
MEKESKNIQKESSDYNEKILEKQKAWDVMAERVARTVDGVGKRIDENIKEAVIALNMLNINTSASCEGHLDRGNAGPWIDIKSLPTPEMKLLKEKIDPLRRQADEIEEQEKKQRVSACRIHSTT